MRVVVSDHHRLSTPRTSIIRITSGLAAATLRLTSVLDKRHAADCYSQSESRTVRQQSYLVPSIEQNIPQQYDNLHSRERNVGTCVEKRRTARGEVGGVGRGQGYHRFWNKKVFISKIIAKKYSTPGSFRKKQYNNILKQINRRSIYPSLLTRHIT